MSRFFPGRDVERQLEKFFHNGITFHDNIMGGFVEFVTELGSNEVVHNLGYIPIGYLLIYADGEIISHYAHEPETWTKELMYFHASAANVTVRLFVM